MMLSRTLLSLFFVALFSTAFAQNEMPNRESFTVELVTDKAKKYSEEVENGPYFVRENVLHIYAGERLLIEVEAEGHTVTSMKVVKENQNPEKTIEVSLMQKATADHPDAMHLKVNNPFGKNLKYHTWLKLPGSNELSKSHVIPVHAGETAEEMWPHAIVGIEITDWKFH